MLKVLLVDDEPFILQGLKLLVDWEKEGFRIAGTAANGMEALAFLKKEKVDLVIADIKMPQMTGLELLEHIRKEKISDAYFVILSGYAEFSFAQQAMQNDCTDYLLKPVDSEILCKVLNKVLALRNREELDHEKNRKLEQAYLARHMIALIQGKFDDLNVRYIHEHMRCGTGVRYVEIQTEGSYDDEGTTDREMRTLQRRLYEYSREYLKEDADLSVFDVSVNEKIYDIGLILFDYVPEKSGMDVKRYLERFREYLASNLQTNVVMLAGKKVQDISSIAKSYGNTCMLRSFQGFRTKKDIYFYEDAVKTCDLEFNGKITYTTDIKAMKLRIKLLEENSKPLPVPWKGENYIKKEIKAGKHVMVVYDEYIIPFHGIMTKAYAEMLAKLFLNTDGSMKRWQVCNIKKKLHKKTYSIQ